MGDNEYHPLTLTTLAPGTGFIRPFFAAPGLVTISAYALEVMTDLRFVPAATIRSEASIELASQTMIARGVRLLLVVDADNHLEGLVTARDVAGERPAEAMTRLGIAFAQVRVADVLTPAGQVEVLPLDEVLHARVGDIVVTLKHSWRQHALVVESNAESGPMLRGIFSSSQIARQLGISPSVGELSQTFADIDRAICASSTL